MGLKFGVGENRTRPFTAWCDGTHHVVSQRSSDGFDRYWSERCPGQCRGLEIDLRSADVPPEVQERLGLVDTVPQGMVLLVSRTERFGRSYTLRSARVYVGGDQITPTDRASAIEIREGEEPTLVEEFGLPGDYPGQSPRTSRRYIANVRGEAIRLPADYLARRQFARQVRERLTQQFGSQVAAAVIAAAGPGQADEAVRWIRDAREDHARRELDELLKRVEVAQPKGWVHLRKLVSRGGLELPKASSFSTTLRVLRGAKVVNQVI